MDHRTDLDIDEAAIVLSMEVLKHELVIRLAVTWQEVLMLPQCPATVLNLNVW